MKKSEVIKKLEVALDQLEAFRTAWQNVKRLCKKDGGEYTRFMRNFEGCSIVMSPIRRPDLEVYTHTDKSGYISDCIMLDNMDSPAEAWELIQDHIVELGADIEAIKHDINSIDSYIDVEREACKAIANLRKSMHSYFTRDILDNDFRHGAYLFDYYFTEKL